MGKRPAAGYLFAALATLALWAPMCRASTFESLVDAEIALERLRQHHRDSGSRELPPRAVFEARVRTSLSEAVALEHIWSSVITREALDAEITRMIERSRLPGRLREYFAALGDDPSLIREALVRPTLVRRLTRGLFKDDRAIHAEARHEIERLRAWLAAGRIDPAREHPMRHLVESGDALGSVAEIPEAFFTDASFSDDDGRTRIARYVVRKKSWDDWWREVAWSMQPAPGRSQSGEGVPAALAAFLAGETGESCEVGVWDNASLDDVPDPRQFATAVWTGSEMLVFGGYNGSITLDSGGSYDPAIDQWEALSNVKAPRGRYLHTAIWSGTRMIVFGGWTIPGGGTTDTGHAYDPLTDSWTALPTAGAPSPRREHTAVWTGTEMIVWGGQDLAGTGGRYDPMTDTWTATTTVGAPVGRSDHTAVWTGTEMIVWGGSDNFFPSALLNTGGRYDPAADSWTPTSTLGAPEAREEHTAVWTESRMIVWGGRGNVDLLGSGAVYQPAGDTWSPTAGLGAPSPRRFYAAAWADDRMIIWGGEGFNAGSSGASYHLASNTWTPVSSVGAPSERTHPVGVWTGDRLIVWSGIGLRWLNTGGRYDPVADVWTETSVGDQPSPRRGHATIWTGSEMIVWGGSAGPELQTGGRYDPALDAWSATTTVNAPEARTLFSSVWTGSEMIVWGGKGLGSNTGGRYDPLLDTWTATSTVGAPAPRRSHVAVWTASEMVVWGGRFGPTFFDSGGRYDPTTDTWEPTTAVSSPAARESPTAVWTGTEMIVWGGTSSSALEQTGGRYDPSGDRWEATSTSGAPLARTEHTSVWTGSEMLVWGGTAAGGGRYDPVADGWSPVNSTGAPSTRRSHEALWTGTEMLVWSGRIPGGSGLPDEYPRDGGRYDPVTDAWAPISAAGAPTGRYDFGSLWTGEELIVWGGAHGGLSEVASGGRYCACNSAFFYRDADADGFGDPGDVLQACVAPDGFVDNGNDCNDANGSIWATPGEVFGVVFDGLETLSWLSPVPPGGTTPVYDVLRSAEPSEFTTDTTCVATDTTATTAGDSEQVGPGVTFYYLVRAENACPVGQGSLGSGSAGVPRVGLDCP